MLKDELIELYKQGDAKHYNIELFRKIYELREKFDDFEFAVNNFKHILDFEKHVIFNKGANKFIIENKLLELIQILIIDLCESFDFDIKMLDESLICNSKETELKKLHAINLELLNFAKELFNVSIERDSFSSKRKGHVLGIISKLLNYYTFSNKFELFIKALQSSKDRLIVEALEELHYYYENFPEEQLSEDIRIELDKIILKTKNRTIATGALNLQVITNCISEFDALSRIDDWKEKFYYK